MDQLSAHLDRGWDLAQKGDAAGATATRGQAAQKIRSEKIAAAIRAAKSDETSLRLQTEFQEAARRPINTKQ